MSRNLSNERQFNRTEWLTKAQIKSFFSRLAASRRKGLLGISLEQDDDVECLVQDSERQALVDAITQEIGLKHPVTYDTYDLCEYHHEEKLSDISVQMLKRILCNLEVPFKSKDKKQVLLDKLRDILSKCECTAKA